MITMCVTDLFLMCVGGGCRPLPQGALHEGHLVPHLRLLPRRVRLPHEPPVRRRDPHALADPLLHRPHQAVPHTLRPVRADPQEERADVRLARHRYLALPAAPGGREHQLDAARQVRRPHAPHAGQPHRPGGLRGALCLLVPKVPLRCAAAVRGAGGLPPARGVPAAAQALPGRGEAAGDAAHRPLSPQALHHHRHPKARGAARRGGERRRR
mmetsp:Transcript_15188/g.48875  ORF Transcript_15188/g.48875 Transcript_15188/m.48875 type:complete len:212 (-) Transcript_15188:352-987(-)